MAGAAIYHVVRPNEGFEKTAHILHRLIREAQKQKPNEPRTLFLDIEGHRNDQGGFDNDMFELQSKFAGEFLMQFLIEAHLPLYHIKNPKPQNNEVPDELNISTPTDT